MGLAPSPDARSTQDMGSLWSTTVESMRESTGFKGPLRCQRPSRHGEACVTRHQDHHQPALLRTSPRILRLAQWRRRCRCCRAGGGSLPLDPPIRSLVAEDRSAEGVRDPVGPEPRACSRLWPQCPRWTTPSGHPTAVPEAADSGRCGGVRFPSPRTPHKFIGGPGTPGGAGGQAGAAHQPGPDGPGRRHRGLRQPDRAPLPGGPGGAGGGRHPGDRRVDPGRPGLPAQAGGRGGHHPGPGAVFIRRAVESWGANPNIELLGNLQAERLSIVSFTVRHGPRYLHHNFVVALLNDLFGIQSRGGCSCAGPYGHRLLGIDIESRPSTWSPTRAGSCSATTASTPPPACGATARARSGPPAPG